MEGSDIAVATSPEGEVMAPTRQNTQGGELMVSSGVDASKEIL